MSMPIRPAFLPTVGRYRPRSLRASLEVSMVPRGTFPAGELVLATPQVAPLLLSLTCTVGVEEGEGERGEVGEGEEEGEVGE